MPRQFFLYDASRLRFIRVDDEHTFGRGDGNSVVVDHDHKLSNRHVRFNVSHGDLYGTDLGSTNGTRLNGKKMPRNVAYKLEYGDVVEFGRQKLLVTRDETVPTGPIVHKAAPPPKQAKAIRKDKGPAGLLADFFSFKGWDWSMPIAFAAAIGFETYKVPGLYAPGPKPLFTVNEISALWVPCILIGAVPALFLHYLLVARSKSDGAKFVMIPITAALIVAAGWKWSQRNGLEEALASNEIVDVCTARPVAADCAGALTRSPAAFKKLAPEMQRDIAARLQASGVLKNR